ncbi:MAG: DNA-protecting protein DprA [Acidobacteria bacterium]|nr:DNA-protecting protein DprA [Acidobacteriota bacterium]
MVGVKEVSFLTLALTLVPGLGLNRAHQLLQKVGTPADIFRLRRAELVRDYQLPEEAAVAIAGRFAIRNAETAAREARSRNISILSYFDDAYPELLRQIYSAPLVLYTSGNVNYLRTPAIALVGSRRCSIYGRQISHKLARDLAEVGLVLVSGLARGIDSCAHLGALDAGGYTIAVMGNGVDVIYPRENRRLYERIRQHGCLISEFPCGSFPAPQNFPIRNRIISGLCYGTLITEASEFSGSLITARLALEQNREVWAVPGNITSPGSYGPNYLIKQGAKIVLSAQDVLDELPLYVLDCLSHPAEIHAPSGKVEPEELAILKLLPPDASIQFERLLKLSGLSQSRLNEVLLELEMRDLIRQLPGRQFARKL